jgi:two-component sensor histidine kinase
MGFVSQIKPLAGAHADIFLILTELFVNALDHGVLGLSSALKSGGDGMERYLLERATRLANLREGRIDIELAGFGLGARTMLRLRVADSGAGFDFAHFAAGESDLPSGRGIALVKALSASLHFYGNGNAVEVCYVPRVEA